MVSILAFAFKIIRRITFSVVKKVVFHSHGIFPQSRKFSTVKKLFCFVKYKKNFLLRKCKKFFNIRARKILFPKYKKIYKLF